jgi:WD40 repeat protein
MPGTREETTTGRPLATLKGHTGTVWDVLLSADGRLLASGGGDGTVRLWETTTGRPLATLKGHTGGVWGVALSADGRLLASGGGDGIVRLWSLADTRDHGENMLGMQEAGGGQLLATLKGHTGVVRGVALSADGRLVISGGYDGTVRLWESSTGTCLRTLRAERRYERLDITRLTGVTAAQREALLALGAINQDLATA